MHWVCELSAQNGDKNQIAKIRDVVWLIITVFSVFASLLIGFYSYSAKVNTLEKKVDDMSVSLKEMQKVISELDKRLYYYERRGH